ncbi:PLP-dependent transferase [Meredithblackwellia eburnea MCA 4105]
MIVTKPPLICYCRDLASPQASSHNINEIGSVHSGLRADSSVFDFRFPGHSHWQARPCRNSASVEHQTTPIADHTPKMMAPKWDHTTFLSERSLKRPPSAIRALLPLEALPGMISLQAGKPAPETFPFKSISLEVTGEDGKNKKLEINGPSLIESLQYSATAGIPRLVTFLEEWQMKSHCRGTPAEEGWSLSVTSGSQDAITKAFETVISENDFVLVEAPCFPGVLSTLAVQPCTLVAVECDSEGISAKALEATLASWPEGRRKPRILYLVPTGGNPTGATATEERRKEILRICRQNQILVFEDDPYCYLTFEKRVPSYWELDAGFGGVVRFDSFSKILSSGLRIGFITGPKVIVDAVNLHTSSSNLQTSSTSQAIAQALLLDWGIHGLNKHCERVAAFYKVKRDAFELAARRQLEGLEIYLHFQVTPVAGMFLWLKLNLPTGDSQGLIGTKAIEERVLAVPGAAFFSDGRTSAHVRVSYSIAKVEDADEAFRRLAVCVRSALDKQTLPLPVSRPLPATTAFATPSLPPALGLLQLDNTFYRPIGDVGNPSTFSFPLQIVKIKGASNTAVVGNKGSGWDSELVNMFITEAQKLIDEKNCVAIVTSCGFLATMHSELVAKLNRPGVAVGTSSLMQIQLVMSLGGPGMVGVITFDAASLTEKHLLQAGADLNRTVVMGLKKGGAFWKWINHMEKFDFEQSEKEVVEVALELVKANPTVSSIVLECTNMPPFARSVQRAAKLPVYDINTLARMLFEAGSRSHA